MSETVKKNKEKNLQTFHFPNENISIEAENLEEATKILLSKK